MLEELANADGRVVGAKQVMRAAAEGGLKRIFIAADADAPLRQELITLAREHDVAYEMVPAKKQLGEAAGIQVAAACAGLLKK